jgi:hypothetical protein
VEAQHPPVVIDGDAGLGLGDLAGEGRQQGGDRGQVGSRRRRDVGHELLAAGGFQRQPADRQGDELGPAPGPGRKRVVADRELAGPGDPEVDTAGEALAPVLPGERDRRGHDALARLVQLHDLAGPLVDEVEALGEVAAEAAEALGHQLHEAALGVAQLQAGRGQLLDRAVLALGRQRHVGDDPLGDLVVWLGLRRVVAASATPSTPSTVNGNAAVTGATTTLGPAAMWLTPLIGGTGAGSTKLRSAVCWDPNVSRRAGSGPVGVT